MGLTLKLEVWVLEKMSSSKPGLFAREATGLVREIGFSLGVIIILSHVIGLGWQKRAFQFSGPYPVPNDMMPLGLPIIFWAFLVVGLIVLVTGYAAGYVSAAMPRSGGGYVTISQSDSSCGRLHVRMDDVSRGSVFIWTHRRSGL